MIPLELTGTDYWITRFVFQRALALIYLVAFTVVMNQFVPLCGSNGLLPARRVLKRVSFKRAASLFFWNSSDSAFRTGGLIGVLFATLALTGVSDAHGWGLSFIVWFGMWALYLSFVNIGQTFYAFGWESLLLETGFLAIFLGPSDSTPPEVIFWLYRWLLFRLMFGAGLIKIRGDSCWRDLTCMHFHYETQPMPNPLSWFFHRLPAPIHKASVIFNHIVELPLPFFYFASDPYRCWAASITILFQALLILSGNFSWLNYLTICLCIPCFDNLPLQWLFLSPPATLPLHTLHAVAVYAVSALVLFLSYRPAVNLIQPRQIMNTSYDRFHLVNTYGAFGSITKVRREIVIEGSDSGEEGSWREYEFKGKPGDPTRLPPLVAPYHFRLDWQMWFAAMDSYLYHPWFPFLLKKLLAGDKEILALLRTNPFPESSPQYIRAEWYEYRFTSWDEWRKTGLWWSRQKVATYFQAVDEDALRMLEVLDDEI